MRIVATWFVCLAALSGCEGLGDGHGPELVANVDQVHLMVPVQAAIDLDGLPGPDGLLAAVLFTREDRPKPVAVSGTLEIMMFDGRIGTDVIATTKPDHHWTFTASELSHLLGTNEYGMLTYRFVLPWGPTPPKSGVVTLAAKYFPPQGPPVYTDAPVNVPLKSQ